ncbi:MAG: DMT family transporter [Oscillospiraceae bacterium]|nr:DMT family transporter [Oscillospiraceae bacterium]
MLQAYIMLITSMLIWGSLPIFVSQVSYSSEQIVLCRVVLGLVFLLLVFLLRGKKPNMQGVRKHGLQLLITGVIMGFNWVFLFDSYRYVDVSIATLCYYTEPVLVCIASAFLFKEKLTPVKITSIAAAVLGMVIVNGVTAGGSDPMRGIACGLLAAVLYGCVTISNKTVHGLSGLETTIVQLIGAAIVMVPYVLLSQGFGAPQNGWRDIVFMCALGILHSGIALLMYFSSMQTLPAQTVALCSYVDPASALFFAAIFLGDRMSMLQWVGAILIIGGAAAPQVLPLFKKKTRL